MKAVLALAALLALHLAAAPARAQPGAEPQPAAPPPAQAAPPADPDAEPQEDPEEREFTYDLNAPPAPAPALPANPADWWTGESRSPVRIDPLGARRARKNDPKVTVANDTPPLLYRLWGLPPLQTMVLRPGEVVIEVWVRPSGGAIEAISRLTVRRDGRVFLQARAGQGCCRPEIARRVDIDQTLDVDPQSYRPLAKSPVWSQPEDVEVEREGVLSAVCVKGSGYDLTLLEYGRSVHLRRVCETEAVGSVAPILGPILGTALGKDPRFDALFRKGADFSAEQAAYERLLKEGGRLLPKTFKR